ncbi:hypothetical protein SGGMMB4_04220 [Sodalis glossinidius str. 'morsitans']|uniref:Hypothetical phage protein n=1 Tax=Sodalis glossinidius (strain morsitans) TaxID=343509 RepID=Q2NRX8_SODGM|nr:hypothetical protein [Sodalis glossinidius]BAE74944.1 hypothetical phage protein [Sodalis glossinidius str. 'morsitans']BAE75097.1 hypothetical phage protein [Sodalis glossinidius str. 'morsitans']CRL46013.1 hypothetical protein SGGMMB4_04220 [Sodalis glossinidius str. 'morsitans']
MMRWKLLTLAAMLLTMTALAIVVRIQSLDITTRLKQANQSMVAERDAARAQFTHYEQAVALFNQIAGATQDAHQHAVQDFQPRIIQIREALTPERCARLPVPASAVNRLRAHADQIPAHPARADTGHTAR